MQPSPAQKCPQGLVFPGSNQSHIKDLGKNSRLGIATELLYTSRTVDARRAQAIGLVSEVVAANELESAGRAMAEDMLKATPLGLRRTKEIFNLCLGVADLDAVLKIEELTQFKLYKTEEMKARMEVFAGPGYSIR